jgi:TRAP transporter TAXI family solute receptor
MRARVDRHFFRSPAGIALLVVTVGVLLIILVTSLRPLPSRHLAMATGPPGSVYAKAGERYREILARDGVQVRLVPTNGAVDNVRLMRDRRSGIEAGFVQSGSVEEGASRDLESLGTVFYEEVWFFCRCPAGALPPLNELGGWRISIGPEGGAGRPLALRLLTLNGIDPHNLKLSGYPVAEAAKALVEKRIDAAVILTGWESPIVQELARAPDITLLSFKRADAYVAIEPTWSKLVLPRGVADLGSDRPPQDINLVASKASLAVRNDLHPALQYLLLQAAMQVHTRPGVFNRAAEFPAAEEIDLPLSEEARHIYRAGPSFLQRSLPFWLAVLVQRLLIVILPLAGIIYPLWSLVPRIYAWQMKRRVNRMYVELKLVERELRTAAPGTRTGLVGRLDELDARTRDLKVSTTFTENTFNLRVHIRALRARALESPP